MRIRILLIIFVFVMNSFGQMTGGGETQQTVIGKTKVEKKSHVLDKKYWKFGLCSPIGGFSDDYAGRVDQMGEEITFTGMEAGSGMALEFGALYHFENLSLPDNLDLALDLTSLSLRFNTSAMDDVDMSFLTMDSKIGLLGSYKIKDNFYAGLGFQLSIFGFSLMAAEDDTYTAYDYLKPRFGVFTIYNNWMLDLKWDIGEMSYFGETTITYTYTDSYGNSYTEEDYIDMDLNVPSSVFTLTIGYLW